MQPGLWQKVFPSLSLLFLMWWAMVARSSCEEIDKEDTHYCKINRVQWKVKFIPLWAITRMPLEQVASCWIQGLSLHCAPLLHTLADLVNSLVLHFQPIYMGMDWLSALLSPRVLHQYAIYASMVQHDLPWYAFLARLLQSFHGKFRIKCWQQLYLSP